MNVSRKRNKFLQLLKREYTSSRLAGRCFAETLCHIPTTLDLETPPPERKRQALGNLALRLSGFPLVGRLVSYITSAPRAAYLSKNQKSRPRRRSVRVKVAPPAVCVMPRA